MKITIEICEDETLASAIRKLQMGLDTEKVQKKVQKKPPKKQFPNRVSKALGARLRTKILTILERRPDSSTAQIRAKLPDGLRAKAGHRVSPMLHDLIHRTAQVKASGTRGKRTYRLA